MLKAIVFDFDGVIVNSEPLHYRALLRVASRFGARFDYNDYLRDFVGFDDRDAFRAILTSAGKPDLAHDTPAVLELCDEKGQAFENIVHEGIETIPGVVDLIDDVYAQMPIAIASGATHADIRLILGKLGLTDRFKVIVTADDVAKSKPDPQTYRLAVQRLSDLHRDLAITPGDCLAIEDTAAGIESARGAGLHTLGLTSSSAAATLSRASRVVSTLEGVSAGVLREWFGE